ncbi:GLPGLI family protein [Parapedobacter tibetensis]|uniref:GLPGLI family protein n=1 Tax=Parapedobacter tibetensis TaxID=2972951 RepID=UPI00214DC3F2|nr:GLPGLI family protein [Parapedobacter tibetensis]
MERKKVISLLLIGVSMACAVVAQESEPALARVIYEFTHINDTLQPDKPHNEEMVLYIGQHASLYGTYSSERVNQQIKKQMEDPAFDGNLTITGSGRSTQESYYTRPAEQLFKQLYSLAGEQYLIDEDYPSIDWRITEETKVVGGYTAQKATSHFKGRDYVAWFTTELPFQDGPWKLKGLPGLILEATDSRNEVVFQYAGFETLEEGEATIALPENAIATNKKALNKLVEAYKKNPQAAMSARSQAGARSAGGGNAVSFGTGGVSDGPAMDPSRIKSINVKKDSSQTSSVTNNPLELKN